MSRIARSLLAAGVFAPVLALAPVEVASAASSSPMVLVVDTGSSCPSHEAFLPLSGTVVANISWGDGTSSSDRAGAGAKHRYRTPGRYTVKVSGTMSWLGGQGAVDSCIVSVQQWGQTTLQALDGAFYGDTSLQSVPDNLPASVVNLDFAFSETRFNQPLAGWDTSHVTSMHEMFDHDTAFNQPIGSWNTAKVVDMGNMFTFDSSFNQPLGAWNTSSVIDTSSMFSGDSAFNQPLGAWNTSHVTTMGGMFAGAGAFNQPLGAWDTSKVQSMAGMFWGAAHFNQPLGAWNLGSIHAKAKVGLIPALTRMLEASGMSSANYGATLAGWASRTEPQGLAFGATGIKYPSTAASARAKLTGTYHWRITDGGRA